MDNVQISLDYSGLLECLYNMKQTMDSGNVSAVSLTVTGIGGPQAMMMELEEEGRLTLVMV